MRREEEVVESYGRFGRFGVSGCVLRADGGRVEERCCGDCVACEA